MGMYGDDHEYAASRLVGTVVRVDQEPVFVHEIRRGMKAVVCNLANLRENYVVDADKLNLEPVPLGMCNYSGVVSYLARVPMRRDWKQGLRKGNFVSLCGLDAGTIPPDVLGNVIKGVYPTFKECVDKIKKGEAKQMAWSREWAIDNDNNIIHKYDGVVGVLRKGIPDLKAEFMYLREALQEKL